MPILEPNDRPLALMSRLRERAAELGMPTWRCDRAGRLTSDPAFEGPMGLWLRSAPVGRLLTQAAPRWETQPTPEAFEAAPGCWLLPIAVEHRRERIGYLVALALGPRACEGSDASGPGFFIEACRSARVDEHATRAVMRPLAVFDEPAVRRLHAALRWMHADLQRHDEAEQTLSGFTRQLTDGFETIDLLYTLGRSMNDPSNPRAFLSLMVERLHQSLAFGWLGAWLNADARCAAVLAEPQPAAAPDPAAPASCLLLRGRPDFPDAHLDAGLRQALAHAQGARALIVHQLADAPVGGSGQVLIQPVLRAGKIAGALVCGRKTGADPQVSSYDMHLLEAAGGFLGAFLDNAVLLDDQRAMFMGTLRAVTAAIDAKDRYTRGHSERVAWLSRRLALAAGLDAHHAERLHIGGLVHDVGKIGVPEAVLGKRGKLTDEEFAYIKLHPGIGYHILKGIPQLEDILPGVLHHHERFDGRGYPTGLAADRIPLYARIIALADTFDAMSSNRSYRAAMPREQVLAEIARCAGSQHDPALAQTFVTLDFAEYDDMVARHASAEAAAANPAATPAPTETPASSPLTPAATPITPPAAKAA